MRENTSLFITNFAFIFIIKGESIKNNEELYGFLQKVGLNDKLNQPRPFTVFLSRQSVLNRLNPIEKDYMVSEYGTEDLNRLLNYMVVDDAVYSNEFPSGKTVCKYFILIILL